MSGVIFKPLYDRVLVQRLQVSNTSAGGILLLGDGEAKTEGTIVAIGAGCKNKETGKRIKPLVKVGERIIFDRKVGGNEIVIDGHKLLIMREKDILGVVT